MLIRGRVALVLGDDIDTDAIIPTRFMTTFDGNEIGKHIFEEVGPEWRAKLQNTPNCILVAGANFGSGSARQQAATGLKGAGVTAILAPSFARSFYRNSANVGLPLLEMPAAGCDVSFDEGDDLTIDYETGSVENSTKQGRCQCVAPDAWIVTLTAAGGIVNYYRNRKATAS